MSSTRHFLYPHRSSLSANRPQEILFDANLQEFAQRVGYIASLETGGKLSPKGVHTQAMNPILAQQ
ncbi:MAG: hypothetical protein HC857_15900, partial [Synechococcales cyanobacterium RU_4_20]|nr:hypothetical protein [Synechococcales cyanobacterium RU_4_20]